MPGPQNTDMADSKEDVPASTAEVPESGAASGNGDDRDDADNAGGSAEDGTPAISGAAEAADTGDNPGKDDDDDDINPELEEIKKRIKAMSEEAKKVDEDTMSSPTVRSPAGKATRSRAPTPRGGPSKPPPENSLEADRRSVYVGNVDYSAATDDLRDFFSACGEVRRVTIICNSRGKPLGYAYVEFKEVDDAKQALLLDEAPFKGRKIKVTAKRTNVPGRGNRRRRRRRRRFRRRGSRNRRGVYSPY